MNILRSLDALLITNATNIRYLTGFVGAEDRDAYVLLTKNKTYFFTNSLYMEQAKKLSPIQISRDYPITQALQDIKIETLEFEEHDLTVAEFNKFSKLFTMIPTQGNIEKLRQIKKADELAHIKKTCVITDTCFDFIIKKLKPGATESEIAWDIETFFRKNNAQSAFSPIVAFGKNSSMPHYQPKNAVLKNNDIVLLDFGAKYQGYCADMTRMVFVGTPKDEWVVAYNTVLQAQNKALELLREGTRSGATLDAAAKEVIAEAGLPPYSHSLGHNVGLDIHEGPRLTVKKDETLLPGMVFSIEPGVYIEGQYGIRIEDLVLLKEDGIEVLSKSKK